jgi:hypothetical protein
LNHDDERSGRETPRPSNRLLGILTQLREAAAGIEIRLADTREQSIEIVVEKLRRRLREILEELEHALATGEERAPAAQELAGGEFWTLGTIRFRADPRPIHIGFLQPILSLPIVEPLSERAFAFLITIKDDNHLLKREHHSHFGWHYHYLDFKQRRSDVILCFDRHATPPRGGPHPLFGEFHAEAGADFVGRPDLWEARKRQSMHEACAPDLAKWPLKEFKNPSNKAFDVWPRGAVLSAPASSPTTKNKKKR